MRVANRDTAAMRGLGGVLAALAAAIAAHVASLPPWVTLLLVAAGAWRWTAHRRGWPLPPKWLRITVAMAAMLVVFASYSTLNGIEAGTAFLVLMAGVKLLETRNSRDLTVLVFIAYFLLYAALLRSQQLQSLPYLLLGVLLATAALMRVHAGTTGDSTREIAKRTGLLMIQAAPLAIALFVLFPRLPGPFWGLQTSHSARTGLNDVMTPGDVSDLSVSGDPAFRVRFEGEIPPPPQRYWRGPVLHEFDGRSWRRTRGQAFPQQAVVTAGEPVDYQITLEPHDRTWILALDLPTAWPEREAYRSHDFQLLSPRPISEVATFRLQSHVRVRAGDTLPESTRRKDTQLPEEGNPRSRSLGRQLATRFPQDPQGAVRAMLQMFREQPYVYTLDPPKLADDAVDEFLFDTRRGFCEHYASAFTFVMRSAGIPARVVTGYQGGELNPLRGYLLVRQSDAHAWSEVWIDGAGWVRVDPTAAVAPERIERGLIASLPESEAVPGRLRQESEAWLQVTLAWDAANDFWNERIVRFDAAGQMRLLERLGVEEPDWRALGLALTASLAAFFVAISAFLAWKYRDPPRDWPARLHAEVARRLAGRGLRRDPAEGPVAFLDRAAATCPDLARDLAEIRDVFAALRYGPLPTETDLRRLKHLVNRLRP
jgi:transglutaminase-like putative cysteine protease